MLNHGVKRRPMLTPPVASPKNVTEGSRQLSVRRAPPRRRISLPEAGPAVEAVFCR